MASCVTCHQLVALALTERGRLLPLVPEVASSSTLAIKSAGPGKLPTVRYLRGSGFLDRGEVRVTAHWDAHPECKPARPRRPSERARRPVRRRPSRV